MKIFQYFLVFFVCTVFLVQPLWGQDKPSDKVIIVMDASGSMLRSMKGETRISIAREVIKDL